VTVTGLENPATVVVGALKDPSMVYTAVSPVTEVSLLVHFKFAGSLQAPKPKKVVIGTLAGVV